MSIDIPLTKTTLFYSIAGLCGVILVVINISWVIKWCLSSFYSKSKNFQNILHNLKINWRFYLSMVLLCTGWSILVLLHGDSWGLIILFLPLFAVFFAICMAWDTKDFPH